ncbi:MAG: BrnT family toxin [Gemmatimonadetes bacterium]|nr:BrnT family toxin [Gemmatimonadota bacterium]
MFRGFEWDPQKNAANLAKHGIDFDDAIGVFDGPVLEPAVPQKPSGEVRFLAIGIADERVTAVVYPPRGRNRRIISARRASSRERATYRQAFPPGSQGEDRLGPG